MRFDLPIYAGSDEPGNQIDTARLDLDQCQIQKLLVAICEEYEGNEPGRLQEVATELGILEEPR